MFNEYSANRQKMVETQLLPRGIKDSRVLAAMKKVPRHLFLDEALWPEAYEDHPLPIGEKQTISQHSRNRNRFWVSSCYPRGARRTGVFNRKAPCHSQTGEENV